MEAAVIKVPEGFIVFATEFAKTCNTLSPGTFRDDKQEYPGIEWLDKIIDSRNSKEVNTPATFSVSTNTIRISRNQCSKYNSDFVLAVVIWCYMMNIDSTDIKSVDCQCLDLMVSLGYDKRALMLNWLGVYSSWNDPNNKDRWKNLCAHAGIKKQNNDRANEKTA